MTLSSPYRQAAPYDTRIPSPPRIFIPAALPDPHVTTEQIPYADPPANTPRTAQVSTTSSTDWSYEQRRSAQQILPHLYLGPVQAAKDTAFLRSAGITLLLGIRQRDNVFQQAAHDKASRLAADLGARSQTFVVDTPSHLIAAFPAITDAVQSHLFTAASAAEAPKVLLFCESGNDRSAAACAAYLMDVLSGVDYVKAVQLVQCQRFCCNFDAGLKGLLQGYWDIVRARREVGGCVVSEGQWERRRGKRARERDVEEDAEMGGDRDEERFLGRSFVPFVDTDG